MKLNEQQMEELKSFLVFGALMLQMKKTDDLNVDELKYIITSPSVYPMFNEPREECNKILGWLQDESISD